MAPLRFMTLSLVSPLLLAAATQSRGDSASSGTGGGGAGGGAGAGAGGQAGGSGYPVAVEAPQSCVPEVNALRQKAGLSPLVEPTQKQMKDILTKQEVWKPVCAGDPPTVQPKNLEGSVAVAEQEGDKPNCALAVQQWTKAISTYSSNPGSLDSLNNDKSGGKVDTSVFVIFNPAKDASLECVFVKCPASGEKKDKERHKELEPRLFCLGKPPLEQAKAIFTEQQWDGIRKVGAATAAAPALLLVATAVVGGLLF